MLSLYLNEQFIDAVPLQTLNGSVNLNLSMFLLEERNASLMKRYNQYLSFFVEERAMIAHCN